MLLQSKQDLLLSNIFTLSEIKIRYLHMISGGKLDLQFASYLLLPYRILQLKTGLDFSTSILFSCFRISQLNQQSIVVEEASKKYSSDHLSIRQQTFQLQSFYHFVHILKFYKNVQKHSDSLLEELKGLLICCRVCLQNCCRHVEISDHLNIKFDLNKKHAFTLQWLSLQKRQRKSSYSIMGSYTLLVCSYGGALQRICTCRVISIVQWRRYRQFFHSSK